MAVKVGVAQGRRFARGCSSRPHLPRRPAERQFSSKGLSPLAIVRTIGVSCDTPGHTAERRGRHPAAPRQ